MVQLCVSAASPKRQHSVSCNEIQPALNYLHYRKVQLAFIAAAQKIQS